MHEVTPRDQKIGLAVQKLLDAEQAEGLLSSDRVEGIIREVFPKSEYPKIGTLQGEVVMKWTDRKSS